MRRRQSAYRRPRPGMIPPSTRRTATFPHATPTAARCAGDVRQTATSDPSAYSSGRTTARQQSPPYRQSQGKYQKTRYHHQFNQCIGNARDQVAVADPQRDPADQRAHPQRSMIDPTPIRTARIPLIASTSTSAGRAITIAQPIGTSCRVFNTAISIADNDSTDAAGRSYSLGVRVTTSELVSTTRTACELKIGGKFEFASASTTICLRRPTAPPTPDAWRNQLQRPRL